MNPYTILPVLHKQAAQLRADTISVYVYKAVTAVAESVANAVGAVRAWNARNALSEGSLRAIGSVENF